MSVHSSQSAVGSRQSALHKLSSVAGGGALLKLSARLQVLRSGCVGALSVFQGSAAGYFATGFPLDFLFYNLLTILLPLFFVLSGNGNRLAKRFVDRVSLFFQLFGCWRKKWLDIFFITL